MSLSNCVQFEKQIEELKKKLNILANMDNESIDLKREKENWQQRIQNVENENSKIKEHLSQLEINNNISNKLRCILEKEKQDLENRLNMLNDENQKNKNEIDSLKASILQLENKIANYNQTKCDLEREKYELQNNINRLCNENQIYQQEIKKQKDYIKQLEVDNENHRQKKIFLEKAKYDLENNFNRVCVENRLFTQEIERLKEKATNASINMINFSTMNEIPSENTKKRAKKDQDGSAKKRNSTNSLTSISSNNLSMADTNIIIKYIGLDDADFRTRNFKMQPLNDREVIKIKSCLSKYFIENNMNIFCLHRLNKNTGFINFLCKKRWDKSHKCFMKASATIIRLNETGSDQDALHVGKYKLVIRNMCNYNQNYQNTMIKTDNNSFMMKTI